MFRRFVLALVAVVVGVGLWPLTPARAADATMTFTGALNVAGLLSAITVQPTTVTVPAGGEVAFVNATTVPLTVTVGSQSARIEPAGSAPMLFTGAPQQETFLATASSLNLPVVGTLTSSVGKVVVRALPVAAVADPDTQPPAAASSRYSAGSAAPEESWPVPAASDGSPDAGALAPSHGAVIPVSPGTSPSGSSSPGGTTPSASSPVGTGGEPSAAVAGSRHRGQLGGRTVATPVLPPFPGFSSRHDQLGLMILLAAAVLAGFGAALARTVLAYRPLVMVGAHSQAARKHRQWRRRR